MNPLKKKLRTLFVEEPSAVSLYGFRQPKDIVDLSRTEIERICRKFCQTAYLGDNSVLCRVLAKYLFFADAGDIGITPHLCLNGYWETWITQTFARVVQPGWNCVDIGANQGYFSVILADAVGESGQLMAVEPNPKLVPYLKKNLEVNGFPFRSTVTQKAVSDINGEIINLVIPGGRGLNAQIGIEAQTGDDSFEVETITLDELVRSWERVDFIKIDAEGAEEAIWRGGREAIRRNPGITIVMEVNCRRYSNPRAFLEEIIKDGFTLRHIDYDSEIKDLTLEQALTERPAEDWMLFLKRD